MSEKELPEGDGEVAGKLPDDRDPDSRQEVDPAPLGDYWDRKLGS